jgi:ATP-dependent RNA helicase RhlE
VNSFVDFKLNKQLLNAIADLGYIQPTEIQQRSIPAILGGQDVMGVSQTGTGKTAAYLLPLLRILNFAQGNEPRALIIVPTRELSIQVGNTLKDLTKYTDLRYAVVFGGQGAKSQIEAIKTGIDILVASPGRFLELYSDGHIHPKKIKHLVLDEAERLMDKSFISQFHRILEIVPQKRQNLLFSATMSDLVRKISGDFMDFPTEIHIAPEVKTAETVSQEYYEVPNLRTKLNLLEHLLVQEDFKKVIIFCKTKAIASNIGKYLERIYGEENIRTIHGNKTQQTRINAMLAFRGEDIRLLVTTDVAARGLDIPDVTHVINFDTPIIYEDYVHRIGRTGRAFKTGQSITFVSPADNYHLEKISKLIKQRIPKKELPSEVKVVSTLFDEQQEMAREIDSQKKKENPEYQGAFHEKKVDYSKTSKQKKEVGGKDKPERRRKWDKRK